MSDSLTEIERGAVMDILAGHIAEHLLSEVGSDWIAYNGVKGTINMTDEELLAKLKEYKLTVEYCVEQSAIDKYETSEPVKVDISKLPEVLRHLVNKD